MSFADDPQFVCEEHRSGDEEIVREIEGPSEAHVVAVVRELNGTPTKDGVARILARRHDVAKPEAVDMVRHSLMCGVVYEPQDGRLARV